MTYNGGGLSYTQSFGYDPLNRLTTSNENGGSSWSQTNGYDRYGNRWIDLGGGNQSLYFNTSNNRISGWSYDSSGNLLNDTIHSYTFDAENKIKTVDSITAYIYDGEGNRVKQLVGENTRFIYGIGGQLIAEFDGSNGNLKKEYVYGGATLITIEPTVVNSNGTRYSTSDGLGSPRVITNSSASVVSRHDYMPFGEELGAGTGGRSTGMGFSVADGNRKKFTGYEADSETGLNFAEARYHSATQGRFTCPDPLAASAKPTAPQSWNRYAYVGNNPMVFSDPSGMNRGPGTFYGNSPEISHAQQTAASEVAEQEEYYEDRLEGKYDSIVITVEPIDASLDEGQNAESESEATVDHEPQNTFATNNPAVIDNKGSCQDCNISVSFTGDSINGMKNGENYYHGNPGLGFTVSISGLGAGGIASLGENKVDPKGHWILQQLMNVYAWNARQGDSVAPTPGYVPTFSDKVDPASIIRHDNRSGGWIDHPGPNMRNAEGKLLTASYSKWNFLIKAYNGKKECRVGFHAEMTFNNGIFRARWGPGLY